MWRLMKKKDGTKVRRCCDIATQPKSANEVQDNNNYNEIWDNNDNDNVRDNDNDDDVLKMSFGLDVIIDDGVKGTQPLSEIYERCNVALRSDNSWKSLWEWEWKDAMKAEMEIIEKNAT